MRVLLVNVCFLLVAFSVIRADSGSFRLPVSAKYGLFLDDVDGRNNTGILLHLMKQHFDLSMEYLLTSKQYGSQFVQRPGMAKFLREASDRQWEEGMDILKKFLQRGGSILNDNFIPSFAFHGKPDLPSDLSGMSDKYVTTLKDMLQDSKDLATIMNHLHRLAGKKHDDGGDAEIAHYFDNKLEKEAELTRKLAGHVNILQNMNGIGIALNMFDSNL